MYETIIYKKEGRIATITFNRPKALNSFSSQMVRELTGLFKEIEQDNDVWVVVVTGDQKAFSAGADIMEKDRPPTFLRELNDLFNSMETCPKPIIAAIRGYCLGGGCEFALSCDFRIAAQDAKIGLPELKISGIPAAGGTFRLPRIVGEGRAKELIFVGDSLSGTEACNIGLVNKAVPAETVPDEAMKLATTLMERPPLAVKAVKMCILASRAILDTETNIDYVSKLADMVRASEDTEEGRRAFREKRKPIWKGR